MDGAVAPPDAWHSLLNWEAGRLYGQAAFAHDGAGRKHRWPRFWAGDVTAKERDRWLGLAEISVREAGCTPENAAERGAELKAKREAVRLARERVR